MIAGCSFENLVQHLLHLPDLFRYLWHKDNSARKDSIDNIDSKDRIDRIDNKDSLDRIGCIDSKNRIDNIETAGTGKTA